VVSCSDASNPGKTAVTDELEAVWRDLGVDPDDAALQGYGIDRQSDSDAETSEWCTDRDQDDRWIARRSAILPAGRLTQDEILEGFVARYRELGVETIRLFRATGGATNVFVIALDTERGFWVRASIEGEGRVSLFVRHSECPVDGFTTEVEGPYEEADLPSG